ncbi:hypothetical protein [Sphingobacterium sp. UBA2074]|uniref:hypothetical protein n=1 Tax=Sphingobacterium sp. UBA2074 TaxID=1947487 RepID=UPI00257E0BEF|nr:hypothetical protein [Sphingobacterium sp. UBA2074]
MGFVAQKFFLGVFLCLLYIFMYNPPFAFLPVSPKYLLYILFIPILLKKQFYTFASKLKSYFFLLIFLILFSFFREINSHSGFILFYINLGLLFEIFIIPIGLIMFYNTLNRGKLFSDIIKVGVFSSLITLFLILNPTVGDFVRYNLLKSDEFTEAVSHRSFGIAESLTYSYGLIQGLLFSLALFYSGRNKKMLFVLPLFFISVLFNARIGFLPILIGGGIYFFVNFRSKQTLFTLLGLLSFYIIIFETTLFIKQKETIQWGLDFFNQLSDFSTGSKSDGGNTFDTLFGSMLVLPDTEFEWLFGTSQYIFGRSYGNSSDVGYILQLYYGGGIYLFSILMIVWQLYKISKSHNYIGVFKYLPFLFASIMLIANIKGNFFSTVGIFRLIVFLCFCSVLYNNKLKINE